MGPICYDCVHKKLGFADEKYKYEEIERGGYNLECPCCGGDHLLRVRVGGDIMMIDYEEKNQENLQVVWLKRVTENVWEAFPLEESNKIEGHFSRQSENDFILVNYEDS